MIHQVGNVELCELLDMEPIAQCNACLSYWDIGIVHCTCGHFLRNGTEENKKICPVHHGSPLDSELLYEERATPWAPLWEESRGSRVLHREFAQEEMQEEVPSLVFTNGSFATRNSARICLTSVALKNYVVKWTNWRTKTTRTTEEISVYRNNWWLRSNTVGSDTMPVRHRADFKQALSTLRQLKHQEDTAHQQIWQSYSSSWWNWQESWWHSSYEHHHEDEPSTD